MTFCKTIPYSSANVGITTANILNKSFNTDAKLFSCFVNIVSDDKGDISDSDDSHHQEWEHSPKEMLVSKGEEQTEQWHVMSKDWEEMQTETPAQETRKEPVQVIFNIEEEIPQDMQNDNKPLKLSNIHK